MKSSAAAASAASHETPMQMRRNCMIGIFVPCGQKSTPLNIIVGAPREYL